MENNSLIYMCPWAKDKKKSWSGTHWNLRKSLEKHYNVIDVDTGMTKNLNIWLFLYKVIRKIDNKLGTALSIRGILENKALKSLVATIFKEKGPILQFGSFNPLPDRKQYIYIDLHYGYVKKMYKEYPDVFKESNYSYMTYKQICLEEEKQKKFFDSCAGIFTMGKWLEKELVSEYSIPTNKVHAVGGGINIDAKKIDISLKTRNRILFVGRDFERKNGPLVIAAFNNLKKQRNNLELYIAGVEERKEYLGEGIHFLGDLGQNQLPQYYNLCDVFIMPSVFEAYGLVFAEALSYGLPCIGLNKFEMPYFIENQVTGLLLNSHDVQELSELINEILSNEVFFDNVEKKREHYLKEYSWDSVANRIMSVINETTTDIYN